jgi:hypothetical protein
MAVVLLIVGSGMLVTGLGVIYSVLYPPAGTPALKPFLEVIMPEEIIVPPAPASSPAVATATAPALVLTDDPTVRVRVVDLNIPFRVLVVFVFKLSLATALVTLGFALVTMALLAVLGPVMNNVFQQTMSGIR